MTVDRRTELRNELDAARDELSAALEAADPALHTVPGLVGEWSARELVAHLAHWADWASTCLDAAAANGSLEGVGSDDWDVDGQNAAVAAEVAGLPMSAVRDREAESYERLTERLASLDPALLAVPAPWGGTLDTIVVENGPGHYAEHAEHVRAWFAADAADAPDDDEDAEVE